MDKIKYKLVTLSSLIISPRGNKAFYEVLGEFSPKDVKVDQEQPLKAMPKVIYPFYQYGEYKRYAPESAEYYLPGSSVKGVFCRGGSEAGSFMTDDVPVQKEDIVLRNLYKAQYIRKDPRNKNKKAIFDVFFENVGVEMIKDNAELKGELYVKDKTVAEKLFEATNEAAKNKMKRMWEYLCELEERKYSNKELENALKAAKENLIHLLKSDNIYIFGGFKGLLHSIDQKASQQEMDGAVYLDRATM